MTDQIEYVRMPTSGPVFLGAVAAAKAAIGITPGFFISEATIDEDAAKAIAAAIAYVKANSDPGVA